MSLFSRDAQRGGESNAAKTALERARGLSAYATPAQLIRMDSLERSASVAVASRSVAYRPAQAEPAQSRSQESASPAEALQTFSDLLRGAVDIKRQIDQLRH